MREQARFKKIRETHTIIILYIYPINNIPLDGPYNKNYIALFCNYSGRSSPHSPNEPSSCGDFASSTA